MPCIWPEVVDDATLFTGAVAIGVVAVRAWLKAQRGFYGKPHFIATLAAMVVWLLASLAEMSQATLDCKVFWAGAAWPAIVFVPTAWSLFLLEYCFPDMARKLAPGQRWLLWGGPVVAVLIVATNPWHLLFYGPATRLEMQQGRPSGVFDHGPLFFLLAGYLYLFLAFAIGVTLRGAIVANRRYRQFFVGLSVITIGPAVANFSYIALEFTVMGFDPTPFAFSAVLTVLAWMIANNHLMDTEAIARDVLFYSVPDPVVVLGPEGRLVAANPPGRALVPPVPADGLAATEVPWLAPVARALVARQRGFAADGIEIDGRYYSLGAAALPLPMGRLDRGAGWVLRLHDMTAWRALESSLSAERDVLSTLMDTSLSGILAVDENGVFVFGNAEAERIIGARVPGRTPLRYDDPAWDLKQADGSDLPGRDTMLAQFLQQARPLRDQRLSFVRRSDRQRVVISLNATPIIHRDTPARVVLSIADITQQHAYEVRLKDAVGRAEAANRAKSQFLANMSHEIRTPLNGVLGMAQVLDGVIQDPGQKEMVRAITDSGELLLAILNDILDMAKIEAGKLSLEPRPFCPADLAKRIDEFYHRQAGAKGLGFEVLVAADAHQRRLGDPTRLFQIIQNLVSNAIKFTPDGEVRLVVADAADGGLTIEVSDTGIGMTPEQAGRVFDEFEQADGTVTRRFGGTGLGLSIVRRLVEMMDGRISVESEPGQGTAITVSLPLPYAPDG